MRMKERTKRNTISDHSFGVVYSRVWNSRRIVRGGRAGKRQQRLRRFHEKRGLGGTAKRVYNRGRVQEARFEREKDVSTM